MVDILIVFAFILVLKVALMLILLKTLEDRKELKKSNEELIEANYILTKKIKKQNESQDSN